MKEKEPPYPVRLIKTISGASKVLSEDVSPWLRPIFNILFVLLFSLITLLLLPFVIVLSIIRKKSINPFFKLSTEADTRWHEGRKEEALEELRRVRGELTDERGFFRFPWKSVSPYGRFDYGNYCKVLWLLYNWELQLNHNEEASHICDEMLAGYNHTDSKRNEYMDHWVVNKARVVRMLEGDARAAEFIMPYLNPMNRTSVVNKYLETMKSA